MSPFWTERPSRQLSELNHPAKRSRRMLKLQEKEDAALALMQLSAEHVAAAHGLLSLAVKPVTTVLPEGISTQLLTADAFERHLSPQSGVESIETPVKKPSLSRSAPFKEGSQINPMRIQAYFNNTPEARSIWGASHRKGLPGMLYDKALLKAVLTDDLVLARFAFAGLVDRDFVNDTILTLACEGRNFPMVKLLRAHALDIRVHQGQWHRAQEIAARKGFPEIVAALSPSPAEALNVDTVEHFFADQKHQAFLALFEKPKAPLGTADKALIQAILNKDIKLGLQALNQGAAANLQTSKKDSLLMVASKLGDLDMVEVLLWYGANAALQNEQGHRAIDQATRRGFWEIAQVLNESPQGALNERAIYEYFLHPSLGKVLAAFEPLKPASPLRLCDVALIQAVCSQNTSLAKKAIFHGADVTLHTHPDNMTLLMNAAQNGDVDMVALLLAAGADPELKSVHGTTALDYARQGPFPHIVERLMRHPSVNSDANSVLSRPLSFSLKVDAPLQAT